MPTIARPVPRGARHLVDTTMFWSPTGGGVRRYLLSKRAWFEGRMGHRGHAGWRQTIVAPGAAGVGFVDCGGWPLAAGYRLPLARAQAAALIVGLAPDLIEAGDPYRLGWAALDAAQRLGAPVLAFCHSNPMAMAARLAGAARVARFARRAAGAYLRRLYREFDCVLAPSRAMAAELAALGVERVERQPLGVDCALFHPRRRDPEWRAALALPAATRLVLYAGRFASEKNLPLLVDAIERLGPPYVLLAIGDGPTPPRGRRVRVLPFQAGDDELARIYASVDGFVHAGDQETFGLAALEAMACGTPAVLRAAGGLAELASGGAAIAVDSARPDAWADAIGDLFAGPREALARAARERAQSYDWQRVMPALLARYERLLAGRDLGLARWRVPRAAAR